MSNKAEVENATAIPDSELSIFGRWVYDNRVKQRKSVPALAKLAGIAVTTLHGIESGKFQNPQTTTQDKLAKALNLPLPPPNKLPPVVGLGPLDDFDPHSKLDWPKCSGAYVLYDISERPIYIGKSANIAIRLSVHFDKFWFKNPIVNSGSFIEVKNEVLRTQLEQILIKFLKKNAIINKQGVA